MHAAEVCGSILNLCKQELLLWQHFPSDPLPLFPY